MNNLTQLEAAREVATYQLGGQPGCTSALKPLALAELLGCMDEQRAGQIACLLDGCQALKEQVGQLAQANRALATVALEPSHYVPAASRP